MGKCLEPSPAAGAAGEARLPKRIRVHFEDDRNVLTREQREEGLRRSWVMVPPDIPAVADLAEHIEHAYGLRSSCPYGLAIFMDDFVLPPFESIDVIRDGDLLRVKRKALETYANSQYGSDAEEHAIIVKKQNITVEGNQVVEYQGSRCRHQGEKKHAISRMQEESYSYKNPKNEALKKRLSDIDYPVSTKTCTKGLEIVEKQLTVTNEEAPPMEIETNGSGRKLDSQNAVIERQDNSSLDKGLIDEFAKRKIIDIDKPECSRKKLRVVDRDIAPKNNEFNDFEQHRKNNVIISRQQLVCNAETSSQFEQQQSHSGTSHQRKMRLNETLTNDSGKVKASIAPESNMLPSSATASPTSERNTMNGTSKVQANNNDVDAAKKMPSRSARRKKAKRLFSRIRKGLLEEDTLDKKNPDGISCSALVSQAEQARELEQTEKIELSQEAELEIEKMETVVPVIVRPGHIRFEPADEEPSRLDKCPAQLQESAQWNNITSKKRGRKWGLQSKKNGDVGASNEHSSCSAVEYTSVLQDGTDMSSKKSIAEEKSNGVPIDYENLYPLMRSPKEGDLIVYRVLELSASLCPELSSVRVGKVYSYDQLTQQINLLPVPRYPLCLPGKEDGDEADLQPGLSLYNEDGSLEIEYNMLIDVRLLKDGESASPSGDCQSRKRVKGWKSSKGEISGDFNSNASDDPEPESITKGSAGPTPENVTNKGWSTPASNDSTGAISTSTWSYRALRGGALGPTVAWLRRKDTNKTGE